MTIYGVATEYHYTLCYCWGEQVSVSGFGITGLIHLSLSWKQSGRTLAKKHLFDKLVSAFMTSEKLTIKRERGKKETVLVNVVNGVFP